MFQAVEGSSIAESRFSNIHVYGSVVKHHFGFSSWFEDHVHAARTSSLRFLDDQSRQRTACRGCPAAQPEVTSFHEIVSQHAGVASVWDVGPLEIQKPQGSRDFQVATDVGGTDV